MAGIVDISISDLGAAKFSDNKIITGRERENVFVFDGIEDVDFTIPPIADVYLNYNITLTNRARNTAKKVRIVKGGGDDSVGSINVLYGETVSIQVTKVDLYSIIRIAQYNPIEVVSLQTTTSIITNILPSAGRYGEGAIEIFKVESGTLYTRILAMPSDTIDEDISELRLGRVGDYVRLRSNGVDRWDIVGRGSNCVAVISCSGGTQAVTATPTKIDCFSMNETSTSGRLEADQANNKIIIQHKESLGADVFSVKFKIIGSYDIINTEIAVNLYVDGVDVELLSRQILAKKDESYTINGDTEYVFTSTAPKDVEVYISGDKDGTITYEKLILSMNRLGG